MGCNSPGFHQAKTQPAGWVFWQRNNGSTKPWTPHVPPVGDPHSERGWPFITCSDLIISCYVTAFICIITYCIRYCIYTIIHNIYVIIYIYRYIIWNIYDISHIRYIYIVYTTYTLFLIHILYIYICIHRWINLLK